LFFNEDTSISGGKKNLAKSKMASLKNKKKLNALHEYLSLELILHPC
jgi:hypothetical protein